MNKKFIIINDIKIYNNILIREFTGKYNALYSFKRNKKRFDGDIFSLKHQRTKPYIQWKKNL